jgi:hypothetical protein
MIGLKEKRNSFVALHSMVAWRNVLLIHPSELLRVAGSRGTLLLRAAAGISTLPRTGMNVA